MSYQNSSFNNQRDNVMSEERFDQIIDAIIDGKYSWACVLILETAGYNPLHYIPYRTYNRLIKQNCTSSRSNNQVKPKQKTSSEEDNSDPNNSKIQDLDYLKRNKENSVIKGGEANRYDNASIDKLSLFSH